MDDEGEDWGEDGEVKVLADEDGVVSEERGIESELDASDVESTVLGQRVVAVEEKCREGEQDQQEKPSGSVPGIRLCWGGCGGPFCSGMHPNSLDV